MKSLFAKLHPRQQVLVAGGVAIGLALLLASVCWRMHQVREEALLRRDSSAMSLAAMQELVAQYRQLEAERGATGAATGLAGLSALVDQSLQGRGFQPSRIQQSGANQLQLRVDAVGFDEALEWLALLEESAGIRLDSVSVSQLAAGEVSVQLALSAN